MIISSKKTDIMKLATFLVSNGKVMDGATLARYLNTNGFRTSYNTPYEGKRGTYTLIKSAYVFFEKQGLQTQADNIAKAFVKPDGSYAYK